MGIHVTRIALFALLLFPLTGIAQNHPSVDAVLKLAQERAYTAQFVNWPNVEIRARSLATTKGEDAAIRFVLKALGDGHSFYSPPRAAASSAADPTSASGEAKRPSLSEPKEPIQGISVIEVRAWSGTPAEGTSAADALQSQVLEAMSEQQCGVVLDFSKNGGGNMWPMLYGLSGLLTDGIIGYFQDAGGSARSIEKRADTLLVAGSPQPFGRPSAPSKPMKANRVAVVVGPRSASSGEIVPIMFHGQSNARLFGRPTAGRSTSNASFPLPNGGTANITTTITLDRNRYEFGEQVAPNEATDQPLARAAEWVASECQRK